MNHRQKLRLARRMNKGLQRNAFLSRAWIDRLIARMKHGKRKVKNGQ